MDLKPHKKPAIAVFITAIYTLLSITTRENFYVLALLYSVLFGVNIFLSFKREITLKQLLLFGLIARLPFLFTTPLLSDDLYRFYWDAKLILNGISPFSSTPSQLFQEVNFYSKELIYANLNSPNYHSVYPTVNQILFTIPAVFSNSLSGFVFLMKLQFLAFDLIGFYFLSNILKILNIHSKWLTLYFLHPLVILEGIGNFHFETIMVSLMSAAVFFSLKNKPLASLVSYTASVLTKLMTLIWIPLFIPWKKLLEKKSIILISGFILLIIIGFSPLISTQTTSSFSTSFGLYFQKFEFNASIYYLVSSIVESFIGYNPIFYLGKILPILSLLLMGWITWNFQKKRIELADAMIYTFFSYYLLATTIHPWYLILGIPLLVFTQNKALIIWSLTIIFSYGFYSQRGIIWLWIEYLPVFFLLFQTSLSKNVFKRIKSA